MTRFALAAALALIVGTQADAQIYYTTPSYYTPAPVVVTSGYYPATVYTPSYYTPAYPSVVTSSYYAPGYTYSSGYVAPAVYPTGGYTYSWSGPFRTRSYSRWW